MHSCSASSPGVAERRVAQVVREADRLGQRLVERECARDAARDLRHLQRVGQPGAVKVALVVDEDLGLVDEAAERRRMHDAVAVALVLGPVSRGGSANRRPRDAGLALRIGGKREPGARSSGTAEVRGERSRAAPLRRVVAGDDAVADAARAARGGSARQHLLVHAHQAECVRCADRRRCDRQARALQQVRTARPRAPSQPSRCERSAAMQHADADRLAVQPLAVAGSRLDRVAEGVAEVQQRAAPVLALVLGDDRGLDLAGAPDRVGERRRVAARAAPSMLASSQSKKPASATSPYLITSASPARSSRGGRVPSVAVSASTPAAGERRRSGSCRPDG